MCTQKSFFAYILHIKCQFLNFRRRAHFMTSYINEWYLFWYEWQEDIHSYTTIANLGLYDLPIDNCGGTTTSPLENMIGKMDFGFCYFQQV